MGTAVVLGGRGEMGSRVCAGLKEAGWQVRAASRTSGVDATSGDGLGDALAGADVVVDALNSPSTSKRAALPFFQGAARHVSRAAADAGVGHVVVLSIVNVTDPGVRRSVGYYAAKAAQEEAYAAAEVPVTVVATTAWFTLADTFLSQVRIGPIAVVPRLGLVPVHPDAATELLVNTATGPAPKAAAAEGGSARRELAGPERTDAASMARALAVARGDSVRVVGVPAPTSGLRRGLLPGPDVPRDDRSFDEWVRGQRPAPRQA